MRSPADCCAICYVLLQQNFTVYASTMTCSVQKHDEMLCGNLIKVLFAGWSLFFQQLIVVTHAIDLCPSRYLVFKNVVFNISDNIGNTPNLT
jgi:hypothetical protein